MSSLTVNLNQTDNSIDVLGEYHGFAPRTGIALSVVSVAMYCAIFGLFWASLNKQIIRARAPYITLALNFAGFLYCLYVSITLVVDQSVCGVK